MDKFTLLCIMSAMLRALRTFTTQACVLDAIEIYDLVALNLGHEMRLPIVPLTENREKKCQE